MTKSILLLLVVALLTVACTNIVPATDEPTPTPLPIPTPDGAININDIDLPPEITSFDSNPESKSPILGVYAPTLDEDILALMDSVSEQQLIAYVQALQGFGTRNSFSNSDEQGTEGIGATRAWITSEFNRVGNGRLVVNYQPFSLTYESTTAAAKNVVAVLPGSASQPNSNGYPTTKYKGVVVIGAHYDTRSGDDVRDAETVAPGANDNASGVAMMLELARLMSSRRWSQTIVFVAFAGEEQGTKGSRAFASDAIINNIQIDWMINNDGIGGRAGIPQSARLFAQSIGSSESGKIARYFEYLNNLYMPDFPLVINNALDRPGIYGDQREFVNIGVGAIRLLESEENEDILNNENDTWEKIDYSYLAQMTRVNLVAVANWAGAPNPPEPPTVTGLGEGNYQVRWEVDPFARGYAVSFRPFGQLEAPDYRFVSATENGLLEAVGLDPNLTYAVSIAPIGLTGRLGGFSKETLVIPTE